MGKIFSYEDIEKNRVPNKDDFENAYSIVFNNLCALATAGEIYGAKIYGSVALGTPSERSDFDLLAITEQDDSIYKLNSIFQNVYLDTKVGIEPIVMSKQFAEKGFHPIDSFFLKNIFGINNERNLVGHDPAEIMNSMKVPTTLVHQQYLAQKVRKLREGIFAYSSQDKLKTLQRALECPVNVGRRTMEVLASIGYATEVNDTTKIGVVTSFKKAFGNTHLTVGFDHLLEKDIFYTNYLREAIKGRISRGDYNETIDALTKESIPEAYKWINELSVFYLNSIEGNIRSKKERI